LRQASHISSQEASNAVARADRRLLHKEPGLGVDERGGGAVGDGDALGHAGGTGGEDDPGVVVHRGGRDIRFDRLALGQRRSRLEDSPGADDAGHGGLAEDEAGAFLGVVRVDGHVGGAGGEYTEDADVELAGTRGDADAHAVAAAHAQAGQQRGLLGDEPLEPAVADAALRVLEGERVGEAHSALPEDVDQRARGSGPRGAVEHRLRVVDGSRCHLGSSGQNRTRTPRV
jgi:hypothetical protein